MAALNPIALVRDGFVWGGRTARLAYLVVWLGLVVLATLVPFTANFSVQQTALIAATALLVVVFAGHTRRRLRDIGWSGWWMWCAALPYVSLIFILVLVIKPGNPDKDPGYGYSRAAFLAVIVVALVILSRVIWAPYWIPAGSMKPNLLIGDFITVTALRKDPERGDVVVFRHPVSDVEFVKRVIGLPGDTVRMDQGRVVLNDQVLDQSPDGVFEEELRRQRVTKSLPQCQSPAPKLGGVCRKRQSVEVLPEGRSYAVLDVAEGRLDTTQEFQVPQGHVFMIGDNRDNSLDSRLPQTMSGVGPVPLDNIVGQVRRVLFSSSGPSLAAFWTWRADRFWSVVR